MEEAVQVLMVMGWGVAFMIERTSSLVSDLLDFNFIGGLEDGRVVASVTEQISESSQVPPR